MKFWRVRDAYHEAESTTRSNESSVLVFRFPVDASMVIIIVRIKLYYQTIRIVEQIHSLSFTDRF